MSEAKWILLVEDDPFIREVMQEFLLEKNFTVEVAEEGADALEKLEKAKTLPCVILLDLMMNGMDGATFRKIQREHPVFAKIPVVVMSADNLVMDKSSQMEANDFLKKPLELASILNIAEKYCSRNSQ